MMYGLPSEEYGPPAHAGDPTYHPDMIAEPTSGSPKGTEGICYEIEDAAQELVSSNGDAVVDTQCLGERASLDVEEPYRELDDDPTEEELNDRASPTQHEAGNVVVHRLERAEGTKSRAHWIGRAQEPGANNYWLVARDPQEGTVVGYLEARTHNDGTQELRSLHVAPGWRSLGIGQMLMDTADREWFDPHAATVLDVAAVNQAGQRFYERNGYEFTDHEFLYGPIPMQQMRRGPR